MGRQALIILGTSRNIVAHDIAISAENSNPVEGVKLLVPHAALPAGRQQLSLEISHARLGYVVTYMPWVKFLSPTTFIVSFHFLWPTIIRR